MTIELELDFAGETTVATGTVTFGRDADIELDTNRFLHRRTGAFVFEGGTWWVHNLGSKLYLSMIADDGTRAELPPGTRQTLAATGGIVRVIAGRSTYEISYSLADFADGVAPALPPVDDGTMTVQVDASLAPREIDFLVSFARPSLIGSTDPMPTYAEVAAIWNVSPKTLDNTVQSIKRKFRAAGLVRDQGLDAVVLTAIQHSLVTRADLEWAALDSGQPQTASSGRRFTSGEST